MGTPSYRILHLTDLHWDVSKANDQRIIIEGLNADLSLLMRDQGPDLLVFSDLVHAGAVRDSFDRAKQNFLDPIRDTAALTNSDILICPGNHDVDRSTAEEQTYFEKGISQGLSNITALNAHIDKYINVSFDKDESNLRLGNFFQFSRAHYNVGPVCSTSYVTCVIKNTTIGKIGFAIFNTAWRSSGAGEIERHHLLLGERTVDFAVNHIKNCDIKVALFHHPLDWLAPWDRKYSQIPLLTNFHLLLFGHVHESMPTLTENAIGQCLLLQGGALYLHRDYYNGYEIIDLSFDTELKASLELRTWFNEPRRSFGPAENICSAGKQTFFMGSRSAAGQKLSATELLSLQNATDEFANKHIRLLQLKHVGNFDNSFTCPPLSHKTDKELLQSPPTEFKKHLLSFDSVLSDSGITLFSGDRESGKTTLALAIAKEMLRGDQALLRIPIFIDFKLLRSYDKIEQVVKRSLSNIDIYINANRVLQHHKCALIVDNVTLASVDKVKRLKELIIDNKNHDWILFFDHVALLANKDLIDEFSLSRPPVFIHPFGRGEIRSLVSKISSSPIIVENTDTVISLIDNNNLPRTPYIVTVLTAVLLNSSVETIFNEASLLEKMIDIVLNKEDPTSIVRGATDFAGQNIMLEQIALWLAESADVLSQDELIIKMTEFFRNRGIKASAVDLYDRYIKIGILERIDTDVMFRYRSIGSYFLAKYTARNKETIPFLLDDHNIIKYQKEFSLLCDISRNDEDLLSYLEVIIAELYPDEIATVDTRVFVETKLESDMREVVDERLSNIFAGRQSVNKIDEAGDIADRARAALISKMGEIENHRQKGDETQINSTEEALKRGLRMSGYFAAWQVWGRALSSLDFVQLKVRAPSFMKLLEHWAKLVSAMVRDMPKLAEKIVADLKNEGKPVPNDVRSRMEYIARVQMPAALAEQVFSQIGASSIHQLLLQTFDRIDLRTPEGHAVTIMLIRHKPDGWGERIKKFIEKMVVKGRRGATELLLLEALYQEYYYGTLSASDIHTIETLIAELYVSGGFSTSSVGAILSRIEQNRPRIRLLSKDVRR